MVYASAALAALFATGVTAQDRPNVLLIMTDNQSPNLLGAYGNRDIKTPNIDQLARALGGKADRVPRPVKETS